MIDNILIAAAVVLAAYFICEIFVSFLASTLVSEASQMPPATGMEALVGHEAVANTDIGSDGGQVRMRGEFWSACSDESIEKGESVIVESLDGLRVKVARKT